MHLCILGSCAEAEISVQHGRSPSAAHHGTKMLRGAKRSGGHAARLGQTQTEGSKNPRPLQGYTESQEETHKTHTWQTPSDLITSAGTFQTHTTTTFWYPEINRQHLFSNLEQKTNLGYIYLTKLIVIIRRDPFNKLNLEELIKDGIPKLFTHRHAQTYRYSLYIHTKYCIYSTCISSDSICLLRLQWKRQKYVFKRSGKPRKSLNAKWSNLWRRINGKCWSLKTCCDTLRTSQR